MHEDTDTKARHQTSATLRDDLSSRDLRQSVLLDGHIARSFLATSAIEPSNMPGQLGEHEDGGSESLEDSTRHRRDDEDKLLQARRICGNIRAEVRNCSPRDFRTSGQRKE
jgi:hypothetical protein